MPFNHFIRRWSIPESLASLNYGVIWTRFYQNINIKQIKSTDKTEYLEVQNPMVGGNRELYNDLLLWNA